MEILTFQENYLSNMPKKFFPSHKVVYRFIYTEKYH